MSSSQTHYPDHYPDERDPRVADAIARYWKKNISIMALLLTIWAAAGLGAGILFADTLNQFYLGGYPLGFWFAQQGSILVFVVLILVYAVWLNRLDKQHHEELAEMGALGDSDHRGAASAASATMVASATGVPAPKSGRKS